VNFAEDVKEQTSDKTEELESAKPKTGSTNGDDRDYITLDDGRRLYSPPPALKPEVIPARGVTVPVIPVESKPANLERDKIREIDRAKYPDSVSRMYEWNKYVKANTPNPQTGKTPNDEYFDRRARTSWGQLSFLPEWKKAQEDQEALKQRLIANAEYDRQNNTGNNPTVGNKYKDQIESLEDFEQEKLSRKDREVFENLYNAINARADSGTGSHIRSDVDPTGLKNLAEANRQYFKENGIDNTPENVQNLLVKRAVDPDDPYQREAWEMLRQLQFEDLPILSQTNTPQVKNPLHLKQPQSLANYQQMMGA